MPFKDSKSKEHLVPQVIIEKENLSSDHLDDSNWLISYADMMTLLCGFFIMLFSMAKLDAPEYEKVKQSIAEKFGGVYQPQYAELNSFANDLIQNLHLAEAAKAKSDLYGVSIVFESKFFFDTLSAQLTQEGSHVLAQVIEKIQTYQIQRNKEYRIVVEGHTDQRPILGGAFPSNWELSSARAARVVRLFLEKGFHPKKLVAIGYGETFPEVNAVLPSGELDPQALAKNRRVVLRILSETAETIPFHVSEEKEKSENSTH